MQAWEERYYELQEAKEEGIRILIESYQEVGISEEITLSKVVEKFSLPEDKAKKYLDKYWK